MDLRNYSIKSRLYAMALAAALALLVITGWSVRGMMNLGEDYKDFVEVDFAGNQHLSDVRAGIGNLRRYEKDMLINISKPDSVAKYKAEWSHAFEDVQASLRAAAALPMDAEIIASVKSLQGSLDQYGNGVRGMIQRIESGEVQSTSEGNKALEPAKAPIRQADVELQKLTKSLTEHAKAQVQEQELVWTLLR